ncbi:hydroxymethylbilane synthase [Porphyrobacter algicida]|uniref:Hydroxymethylbilane synthase n=1 Tax=Qipengyuania algicida TaxID=1836209 RepID=A0A845AIL8_9SPHN|nr:hydroxymethylbilane synthase [Qipengyuania algicida]MXP28685.1 hydroxymethylbilane synthase [Qipengyuania algicida]
MTSTLASSRRLRLGTRQSPLAMAQANETRSRLCAAHGWTVDDVELVPVLAGGDRIQDRALADIGGKALWTRELDQWLAEGRIDAAVHSMKDVETLRPDSLTIAAILPRADKADVLLGASSIAELPQNATVGTSAPRRAAQLLSHRPDCRVVTFRGNVATRQRKLAEGEVDATFLAAAGLDRLGESGIGTRLDPQEWLPAPAQAAIGIECHRDADEVRGWLSAIDHAPSHDEVMAERALLAALGGSCHSAVACLTRHDGNLLVLRAAIFSPDGSEKIEGETRFSSSDEDAPLALGRSLLARASAELRATFDGTA